MTTFDEALEFREFAKTWAETFAVLLIRFNNSMHGQGSW